MQKYSPMFAYIRMASLNARKMFQRRPGSRRSNGKVTDEFRRTLRALISQDYLSPDGRQCRLREIFGLPPKPPESSRADAPAGGESNPVKPLFPEVPYEPYCFQRPVRGGSAVAVLAGRLEQKLAQSCQVRRGDETATGRAISNNSMAGLRHRYRNARP